MKRELERNKVIKRLQDLAFGRSNDAVRLVLLNEENDASVLNELDMTMLSEVKRGQNGTVELKLINRLDAIKLLLDELRMPEKSNSGAAGFIAAINAAARHEEDRSDDTEY